jgi:hypothetical protein
MPLESLTRLLLRTLTSRSQHFIILLESLAQLLRITLTSRSLRTLTTGEGPKRTM